MQLLIFANNKQAQSQTDSQPGGDNNQALQLPEYLFVALVSAAVSHSTGRCYWPCEHLCLVFQILRILTGIHCWSFIEEEV